MAHLCRGFLPGNQKAIGVDFAQIPFNPDDVFPDNFELDELGEVINNRLFAAMTLHGEIPQTTLPYHAVNTGTMC
jgi:hypothetical protein